MVQECKTLSRKLLSLEKTPEPQTWRNTSTASPSALSCQSSRRGIPGQRVPKSSFSTKFPTYCLSDLRLASVFLLVLNFLICFMGTMRDTDRISETVVTSIYCPFILGQALRGYDI